MRSEVELGSRDFLDSPLLSQVDNAFRISLLGFLERRRVPTGTPLLRQGEPNQTLYFVLTGSVAIERRQSGGRLDVLARLSGPAIFGTTTFFHSTLPSASIVATSALDLWTLDRKVHEGLRREDPRLAEELALAIVAVLSERFDVLDARIGELMDEHGVDHPRSSELADFRSKLFDETSP